MNEIISHVPNGETSPAEYPVVSDWDSTEMMVAGASETSVQTSDFDPDATIPRHVLNQMRQDATAITEGNEGTAEPVKTAEVRRQERLDKLFAPIEVDSEQDHEDDYARLLDPDTELTYSIQDAAVRKKGRHVTEQSIRDATLELNSASAKDAILEQLLAGAGKASLRDISAQLRTDPLLRKAVGTYLLEKTERIGYRLPPRVARNAQKNPGSKGYESLRGLGLKSYEYTALLALSMLDGTFRAEAEDPISESARNGTMQNGQHRTAARQVLHARPEYIGRQGIMS